MIVAYFQKMRIEGKGEGVSLGQWLVKIVMHYSKWNSNMDIICPEPTKITPEIIHSYLPNKDYYGGPGPIIVDPLGESLEDNVIKGTDIDTVIQMFLTAIGSIWTDCTCCCHKEKLTKYQKYAEGNILFFNRKHSALSRIFDSSKSFKKLQEMKSVIS